MTATVKRRVVRAGGWGLAKRLIKPIPIVGSVFALALAGYEIKKKGLLPGAIHVGLDVTPIVGTAKNVIEIFTGDWIPDRPAANGGSGNTTPLANSTPVANTPQLKPAGS
jgi:hypothetical protein